MAWSSNTKNGWMVVHESKEVDGPFESREKCVEAAAKINEPEPIISVPVVKKSKKRKSRKK